MLSLQNKLAASGNPALNDIAQDLSRLHRELAGGATDGGRIGEILARVGPKVTDVAAQGGAASGTLRSIGQELTAAGRALGR